MAQTLLFTISSDALPAITHVVSVVGREAISEPYAFLVGLEINDDGFNPDSALRAQATLHVNLGRDAAPYFINGILASIELLHQYGGKALYRATLVPKLWQLRHDVHSRIFTDASIIEIIQAVLEHGGLGSDDFRFQVLYGYPKLEHVCQYKESGLAFISRWMEREGLYYFFEQEDGGEKLIITDSISFHRNLSSGNVRYIPLSGTDSMALEALDSFMAKHSALPASVKLTDYDYLRPTLELQGSHAVDKSGRGDIQLFGENLNTSAEGSRYAKVRAEELLSGQKIFYGHGRVFHLRPNYRFALEEHPNPTYNGKSYLVTELEHVANQSATDAHIKALLGIAEVPNDEYTIRLTAIGADVQFRAARRHSWPRVDGYEFARVDGEAASEYAQIDEHGRYKCRILFDESDLVDGSATTWVRMMQPHGGSIEGFHFPLRKATEVVIFFLAGDPDRPVIAGVVPNPLKQSPITSANHTKNVLQTGGRNRFELEDLAGAQRITLSTPYSNTYIRMGCPNQDHELKIHTNDRTLLDAGQSLDITVGSWRHDTVAQYYHTEVTGDVSELYDNGQRTTVNNALRWGQYNVGKYTEVNGGIATEYLHNGHYSEIDQGETHKINSGSQTIEVTPDRSVTVHGNISEHADGNIDITAGGNVKIDAVGGTMELHSKGDMDIKHEGSWLENITGAKVSYGMSATAEFKLAASFDFTAGIDISVFVGASAELSLSRSFSFTAGTDTSITLGATLDIMAGVKCDIFGGLSIDLHAGPRIEIAPIEIASEPIKLGNSGLEMKVSGLHLKV
jgi:type VI secretion system secreted protein VgrG